MKSTGYVFKSRDYTGSAEPPATVLEDESRFGNDGTFEGDGQPNWVRNKYGLWVLDFDGDNDIVNCGNDPSLQFSCGSMTIEFWIAVIGAGYDENFIGKYDGGGVGWYSSIRPDSNTISWRPEGGILYLALGVDIDDGNLHQVVIAQEGTVAKLSTDGVYRDSWAGCYQNISTVQPFTIGGVVGQFAVCRMVGVRLRNYPLSSEVVAARFQEQKHWVGV